MKITEKDFGQGYHLITLENKNKLVLSVSDLGARIVCLKTNDQELVLGFDTAEEYIEKRPVYRRVYRSHRRRDRKWPLFSQWKNLPISYRSKNWA